MKARVLLTLLLSATASLLHGQASRDLLISRADTREVRVAPAANFTGTARIEVLFDTSAVTRAYSSSVSFEPGARTAWHTHASGQILIVTAGLGHVQLWGGPVEAIAAGDEVRIPPNAKHWHGAAPTTTMTQISIVEHSARGSTQWLELVSDAQQATPRSERAALEVPTALSSNNSQSRAQQLMSDIAPKLAQLTDTVLLGDVWSRLGLARRDGSLVTVSALIATNRPEQLRSHMTLARQNSVTRAELVEAITQLAFYVGWPNAISAIAVAREVFADEPH
jgi:4-carboxymuconolactone decarboxylase